MDPRSSQPRSTVKSIGFAGNPDIYGLGIRLGYYTQAVSVWAANIFLPSEAQNLHTINISFVVAMLIALGILSRNPRNTYAVEPFLLIQITYYIADLGTKDYWRFHLAKRLARNGVVLGLDCYNVWFWWRGMDRMKRTPGDYGTQVWYFGQGDMYGWIRTFFKVLVGPFLVWRTARICFALLYGIRDYRFRKRMTAEVLDGLEANLLEDSRAWCLEGDICDEKAAVTYDQKDASFSVSSSCSTKSSHLKEGPYPSRTASPNLPPLVYSSNPDKSSKPVWCCPKTPSTTFLALRVADHQFIRLKQRVLGYRIVDTLLHMVGAPPPPSFFLPYLPLLSHPPLPPSAADMLPLIPHLYWYYSPPPPFSRGRRIFFAIMQFTVVSTLVIAVELAIQWNQIRGVQTLDTVGQLVPCVLGFGGLLKVVWGILLTERGRRGRDKKQRNRSGDSTRHGLGAERSISRRVEIYEQVEDLRDKAMREYLWGRRMKRVAELYFGIKKRWEEDCGDLSRRTSTCS